MNITPENKKNHLVRLALVITNATTEEKLSALLDDFHIHMRFQCRALGTATSSEILDICGLGEIARVLTFFMIPKEFVRPLFEKVDAALHLREKGTGIAVSIPLTGLQGNMIRFLNEQAQQELAARIEQEERKMRAEAIYSMILVTVNQGYSDEVIDTARKAGATGGTIIKGRRRGLDGPMKFWGISLQEEQEILSIITRKETKAAIMSAISHAYGLNTPAQGLVLALPVDEIIGLGE